MSEFLRLQSVLIALVCVNYFARVARFIMYQCANANFSSTVTPILLLCIEYART